MKPLLKIMKNLDTFTRAYIECALWSSTDHDGEPLDKNYSGSDLSQESLQKMIDDCAKFQSEADLSDYPNANAGHDFWLTRNRHGAGFWENDYGTEEQCAKLTELAHSFGGCDLYVGDDKQLWI